MKKFLLLTLFFASSYIPGITQLPNAEFYNKKTYMIPMRDGVKLFTVILTPTKNNYAIPFLIERTPYGADFPLPEDSSLAAGKLDYYSNMAEEGYIFVFQDLRGKFKSEGMFEM